MVGCSEGSERARVAPSLGYACRDGCAHTSPSQYFLSGDCHSQRQGFLSWPVGKQGKQARIRPRRQRVGSERAPTSLAQPRAQRDPSCKPSAHGSVLFAGDSRRFVTALPARASSSGPVHDQHPTDRCIFPSRPQLSFFFVCESCILPMTSGEMQSDRGLAGTRELRKPFA